MKVIDSYDSLLEFDTGLANQISAIGMPENIHFEITLTSSQWKRVVKSILQFIPNRMVTDTITQLTWVSPITNISYKLIQLVDKYKQK